MSPELNLYYEQLTRQVASQFDAECGQLSGLQLSTPDSISPQAQQFCLGIVPGSLPEFVASDPLPDFPANHCHEAVEQKKTENGGSKVLGWTIWEWREVMIEAERHAVWRSPAGDLLDVSPKIDGERSILFLPDPGSHEDGGIVESRRLALRSGRLTDDLFKLIETERSLLRSTEGAGAEASPDKGFLGALIFTKIIAIRMLASNLTETATCACENGASYSECHGQAVDDVVEHFQTQT